MNVHEEIKDLEKELVAATLAVAFTHLAMAPYDSWSHEGSPAEMATYVVKTACDRGNFGFLSETVLGTSRKRQTLIRRQYTSD